MTGSEADLGVSSPGRRLGLHEESVGERSDGNRSDGTENREARCRQKP